MKKALLLGSFLTLCLIGSVEAVALDHSKDSENQEQNAKKKQSSGEQTDIIESDSSQIITDGEFSEQDRVIMPPEIIPQQPEPAEPESPAEDESSAVSSFNFFYFLIEKIKFPDLLDESF